jgi:sn-glycerol 3-phosphate transport system ATP-binding protein
MSVYDNMAYGLRIRGMSREAIDARVRAAAATLELGNLLARKPRQLSGGQRQRVAMGRAIVREPAVFLFDEPLSNLDAKLRVQMRLEMKRLHAQVGTTSIYVTHDQVEAMTLADRLIVMNAGRVEQIGTPLDVYHRPATAFVAGFIGSPAMNLMPGRPTQGGVDVGEGVVLPLGGAAPEAGRAVLAGIRPEHVAIVSAASDHLKLTVDAVEMLGADSMIHGRLGGAAMTMRVPGSAAVSVGEVVPISVPGDRVSLFDAASGERL